MNTRNYELVRDFLYLVDTKFIEDTLLNHYEEKDDEAITNTWLAVHELRKAFLNDDRLLLNLDEDFADILLHFLSPQNIDDTLNLYERHYAKVNEDYVWEVDDAVCKLYSDLKHNFMKM
jgi:hypothetical protein